MAHIEPYMGTMERALRILWKTCYVAVLYTAVAWAILAITAGVAAVIGAVVLLLV